MPGSRTSPEPGADEGAGSPRARSGTPPGPLRKLLAPRGDIPAAVRRVFAPHLETLEGSRFWSAWRRTLRLLRPLGRVSQENRIEVFIDGDAAFEAMFAALEGACREVLVNTYILEPDRIGLRLRELLVAAAERGVEVLLVYDAFGSGRLGERYLGPLQRAGVRLLAYNPLLRIHSPISRLQRNHQKILVVDGEIGFCGGMNMTEEYAGPRLGTGVFRDTHLELRGPCVADLAEIVLSLVEEVGGDPPARPPASAGFADGALVQVLESNVTRERRAIQKALRYTVMRAVRRCYLTSPYFVPPKRLLRDLSRAAQRGVDVRILTAGVSDVPLVRMASRHLYGRLLKRGVRIYELGDRTLHAKTVAIDGIYASVGSFNLDTWSYRRNLEVNVSVLSENVAGRIEAEMLKDLERSHEVSLGAWGRRTWFTRLRDWLAYLLMRI